MRTRVAAIATSLVVGCAFGSGDGEAGSAGLGAATDAASTDADDGADAGGMASGSDGDATSATATDDSADTETAADAKCGDGQLGAGEECDDGNPVNGDGCNLDCRISGQLDWQHVASAAAGENDEAWDIAEAPDGNVYVVGFQVDAAGGQDGWFRKLNPLGGMLWTELHDGPAGGNDAIRGVAVETSGLVVVAGHQSVTSQGANLWVRQYDGAGNPQWTDTYNGAASSSDGANSVVIDAFGDIVVAGHTTSVDEGRDVLLRKYATDGSILWTRTFSGSGGTTDHGWSVDTSLAGEIYAVGYEGVTAEGRNAWLGKYDIDGNLLWARGVNGDAGLDDELRGVVVVDDGVVVCGFTRREDIPWQAFVRKYDDEGTIAWTVSHPGATGHGAHCNAVARDASGDLVWTGVELAEKVRHAVVSKLDPEGNERWTTLVPVTSGAADHGRGIEVGDNGEILVAGRVNAGIDGLDPWAAGFLP